MTEPAVATPIAQQKRRLRRELRRRRDAFAQHSAASAAICMRLAELPVLQRAATVHSFLPIGSEVNLYPLLELLLQRGVRLAVPVLTDDGQLLHSWAVTLADEAWQPAPFATRAPLRPDWLSAAEIAALDVVLVPLLGFDRSLRRIGYGAGYYDRLLPLSGALRLGVGFSCQQEVAIPWEAHDESLDAVVTEETYFSAVNGIR